MNLLLMYFYHILQIMNRDFRQQNLNQSNISQNFNSTLPVYPSSFYSSRVSNQNISPQKQRKKLYTQYHHQPSIYSQLTRPQSPDILNNSKIQFFAKDQSQRQIQRFQSRIKDLQIMMRQYFNRVQILQRSNQANMTFNKSVEEFMRVQLNQIKQRDQFYDKIHNLEMLFEQKYKKQRHQLKYLASDHWQQQLNEVKQQVTSLIDKIQNILEQTNKQYQKFIQQTMFPMIQNVNETLIKYNNNSQDNKNKQLLFKLENIQKNIKYIEHQDILRQNQILLIQKNQRQTNKKIQQLKININKNNNLQNLSPNILRIALPHIQIIQAISIRDTRSNIKQPTRNSLLTQYDNNLKPLSNSTIINNLYSPLEHTRSDQIIFQKSIIYNIKKYIRQTANSISQTKKTDIQYHKQATSYAQIKITLRYQNKTI